MTLAVARNSSHVTFKVVGATPRNVGAGKWVERREQAKLLPIRRDRFGREIESRFSLELFATTQPK